MIQRRREALARGAFTLMEMMVVVAIIVVLVGASVPIYMNYAENSKIGRVKLDTRNLQGAVQAYSLTHGSFPNSLEDLTQPDSETGKAVLTHDHLMDPWGQPYVYSPNDVDSTGVPYVYSNHPGCGKQAK
jgi:general secretion pathway protein G